MDTPTKPRKPGGGGWRPGSGRRKHNARPPTPEQRAERQRQLDEWHAAGSPGHAKRGGTANHATKFQSTLREFRRLMVNVTVEDLDALAAWQAGEDARLLERRSRI